MKNKVLNSRFLTKSISAFQTNAKRFEKLDPNDKDGVENTFNAVFKVCLNGNFKNLRRSWANKMTASQKYNLMKKGYEIDKLRMPDFIQHSKIENEYVYKILNLGNFHENSNEAKINYKSNMKNLVFESLDELLEAKKAKSAKEEIEKSEPKKVAQSKKDKIDQAIKALEKQLKDVKAPGKMKETSIHKKAKIAEIEKKIEDWKKKLK